MLLVSTAPKHFLDALTHLHNSVLTVPTIPTILMGDFNVNLMEGSAEQKALKKYLITDRGYTQLIEQYTTDYRTQIDHILYKCITAYSICRYLRVILQ